MVIYVSASCLNSNDLFSILDVYDRASFKNIELGSSNQYNDQIAYDALNKYDFNFLVHNYFPPPSESFVINVASQNKAILDRSLNQLRKTIDFCNRLGIELFSFHSGFRADPDTKFYFDPYTAVPYKKSMDTFIQSLVEINKHAENCGVKIAIENNVISDYNLINGKNELLLMCEHIEFEKLFEEITSDNIGILLDLGHLNVTSNLLGFDKYEFINRIEDKVFSIHVHDNNGKIDEHNGIKENSWCLEVIKRKCFKGLPIILESAGLEIEEIIQNEKLLKKYI